LSNTCSAFCTDMLTSRGLRPSLLHSLMLRFVAMTKLPYEFLNWTAQQSNSVWISRSYIKTKNVFCAGRKEKITPFL